MTPSVSRSHSFKFPHDITFSGSGFLSIYQLGVALGFLRYAPWILKSAPHILGASAGSLAAAAVACDVNPIAIRDEVLLFAKQLKATTWGLLNPSVNVFQWLEKSMRKHLPSNAHRLATGRLGIAVTRLSDGKQVIISEFQSKEDVVQALLCSCFLPGYCGFLPPLFRGVHYIDGGLSGIMPRIPESSTLTVCPFSGDTDICPTDPPCTVKMVVTGAIFKTNMANFFRMITALSSVTLENKDLEQSFHNGYKDAINFLWNKDLASFPITHSGSQGVPSCDPTSAQMPLETTKVEEEETKGGKLATTLTSFTDHRSEQIANSTVPENTKEPPLHFDDVQNVLLGYGVTYQGTFGLPVKILSSLLLPLILSFYALLPRRQRMKVLFREVLDFVVWGWLFTKFYGLFILSIFVCSLMKNIKDRVTHVMLLLL
ncbi:patatin-like phospholipase domain-containing protein 2 [Kryptolebias marmoratus]|uniref:Patatin-like phospholipase domain-containing protein 2 n=1 Tax=Kryptolebias marmoratus TaxID=37003 RepID=A0A3Q3GVW8_KRYMA|nr:patatin-like phospholipase domain-containing protein 2 [Kryptolebias marmoratus]